MTLRQRPKSPLPYFGAYLDGTADSFVLASNGAREWFERFWMTQRYRAWVYSWQRKALRDVDFNPIGPCFTHKSFPADDA